MADPANPPSADQIPPGLLAALSQQSSSSSSLRPRPATRPLQSFPDGLAAVSMPESTFLVNKYDLHCPRAECASLILRTGAAKLVEKPGVQMEPADRTHELLPALPAAPDLTSWWLVSPSPMEFENIGFSKPLASAPDMKLLACAECDLGPVGWSQVGGTEFWLASSRVSYRA